MNPHVPAPLLVILSIVAVAPCKAPLLADTGTELCCPRPRPTPPEDEPPPPLDEGPSYECVELADKIDLYDAEDTRDPDDFQISAGSGTVMWLYKYKENDGLSRLRLLDDGYSQHLNIYYTRDQFGFERVEPSACGTELPESIPPPYPGSKVFFCSEVQVNPDPPDNCLTVYDQLTSANHPDITKRSYDVCRLGGSKSFIWLDKNKKDKNIETRTVWVKAYGDPFDEYYAKDQYPSYFYLALDPKRCGTRPP
jgi:hypothetical protein